MKILSVLPLMQLMDEAQSIDFLYGLGPDG